MTVQEMIKKFNISLAEQDGVEMIKVSPSRKPTAKQITEIKRRKPEIIAELKEIDKEWKIAAEQEELEYEKKKREYIENTDLRRCLIVHEDEWYNLTWTIATLDFSKGNGEKAYQADYGVSDVAVLEHQTEKLKGYLQNKGIEYGMFGMAWEITPEAEKELIEEQIPTEAKAKKEEEEKAAAKEVKRIAKAAKIKEERQAKFDKAKATGEKVVLSRYVDECDGSVEECSTDIVYEYAMPDGDVKWVRVHTH